MPKHTKSNFKDDAVSPKMNASEGKNAKLKTQSEGVHTVAASPGKHPFKPAMALRSSRKAVA